LQNAELMAKCEDLELKRRTAPKGSEKRGQESAQYVPEGESKGKRTTPSLSIKSEFARTTVKREGEQSKLLTIDVTTGGVRRTVDIPETGRISGLTLHPDAQRLVYNRSETQYDIWMLEGLPRPATGWMALFRHWREP
jgi:hypothetical protein